MKKRVISAIIMLAIIIPLVIIGKIPFAIAVGCISMLAFYEITKLNNYPVLIRILGFIGMILLVYSNYDINNLVDGLNYKVLGICLLLILLPSILYQTKEKYDINDALRLFGFIFLVGFGLNLFILIRSINIKYFLFMLLIPIFTDTFAYITGSLVGKHKFTKISPNKSIEGCVIGSLVATFIMTMYYTTFIGSNTNILIIIGIVLLLSVVGQLGDLFFSAIKRKYDIKDFSNLIPGHGGILDRLDSLIFVAITFIIFINFL